MISALRWTLNMLVNARGVICRDPKIRLIDHRSEAAGPVLAATLTIPAPSDILNRKRYTADKSDGGPGPQRSEAHNTLREPFSAKPVSDFPEVGRGTSSMNFVLRLPGINACISMSAAITEEGDANSPLRASLSKAGQLTIF